MIAGGMNFDVLNDVDFDSDCVFDIYENVSGVDFNGNEDVGAGLLCSSMIWI